MPVEPTLANSAIDIRALVFDNQMSASRQWYLGLMIRPRHAVHNDFKCTVAAVAVGSPDAQVW
jgi:hypothetical protein